MQDADQRDKILNKSFGSLMIKVKTTTGRLTRKEIVRRLTELERRGFLPPPPKKVKHALWS
jgi:hypothetical protein